WHEVVQKEQEHTITSLTFSPDARWVIVVENDANVSQLDVFATKSWQSTHIVHGSGVSAISISPDSRLLLTKTEPLCYRGGQNPGIIRVWQISDGGLQASSPLVDSKCQSPGKDKQQTAAGKTELIRDSANWVNIQLATPDEPSSPDGRWIAKHEFD